MGFEARILLLILLVHIAVSGTQLFPVSCSKQTICALKAASVNLTCSYSNTNITTGFWFYVQDKAKWRNEEHPEDLALDSDYAGRVNNIKMTNFSSTLTITDLRERDSGEYHLMLITDKGEKCLSSTGVNLTVTDLQVTYDTHMTHELRALTCRTSCLLTISQQYYWYKDGQYLKDYTDNMGTFPVRNADKGSYFCSVHGYNEILSRPLCVGGNCWSVTYTNIRVCVLEGSSVEFAGSYSHPGDQSVMKVYWHSYEDLKQDLKQETQFLNRVEYVNKNRDSTLKINQVTKKDSGEYRLRFITNERNVFSGRPGVVLNVTDLQVRVSESTVASEGQTAVTLSCITSCTLSNNLTYVWYKNGQRVPDKPIKHNKLYLINIKDSGNYSCAVRGREDLRSPEQPVILLEGEVVAGQPSDEPNDSHHTIITVGVLVCLSLIIIAGALWMCRRKFRSVKSPSTTVDPKSQSEQSLSHQDDVHYSSIHFPSRTQGLTLSPGGRFPLSTAEDEYVQYAEVNIKTPTAAT